MAMGETEIKWRLWGAKKKKKRRHERSELAGICMHLLDKRVMLYDKRVRRFLEYFEY